jgi:hypothetical protein
MAKRRRRYKQTTSFKERLAVWAADVRGQAERARSDRERDHLLRRARQADTASNLDEWINSSGLQAPK